MEGHEGNEEFVIIAKIEARDLEELKELIDFSSPTGGWEALSIYRPEEVGIRPGWLKGLPIIMVFVSIFVFMLYGASLEGAQIKNVSLAEHIWAMATVIAIYTVLLLAHVIPVKPLKRGLTKVETDNF